MLVIVAVFPTYNAPPIPTPPYTCSAPVAVLLDICVLVTVVIPLINVPTLTFNSAVGVLVPIPTNPLLGMNVNPVALVSTLAYWLVVLTNAIY